MKKIAILGLGCLLIYAWVSINQNDNIKTKIIQLIEQGDVEQLAEYFSEDLVLRLADGRTVDGVEDSKNALQTLFESYPPQKFIVSHSGNSKGGASSYLIGRLQTSTAAFRVTIAMANDQIEDLSFEWEKLLGHQF